MDWQTTARNLRIGTTRKVQCCGADASALASNNERGLSLHCFRCGRNEWEPHGVRSIAEIMATRRANDTLERAVSMPDDAVALTAGPSAALVWVLAGGLQPERANDDYGFRWHEQTRRVLIPLTKGILGRAVHGERPKYLRSGPTDLYTLPEGHRGARVVVEDILSAIAINRAGWPAAAVLGTSISPEQAAGVAAPLVIGWFDGDAAGDAAFVRLRKRLALHPCVVKRISTALDPKRLHRATLIEHLEGI